MEKSNNTAHVITAQRKCSGEGVQFHNRYSAADTHFVHTLHCLARKGFLNWLNVANTIPVTRSCSLTSISLCTGTFHFLKNILLLHKARDACKVPSSSHQHSPGTEMGFFNKDKSGGRSLPKNGKCGKTEHTKTESRTQKAGWSVKMQIHC